MRRHRVLDPDMPFGELPPGLARGAQKHRLSNAHLGDVALHLIGGGAVDRDTALSMAAELIWRRSLEKPWGAA